MGNSRAALRLIIRAQQDIPRAIEFVRLQRDEELWEELIDWALSSADTTGGRMRQAYTQMPCATRSEPPGQRFEPSWCLLWPARRAASAAAAAVHNRPAVGPHRRQHQPLEGDSEDP